eukprot:1158122-Pelagomonas_calceolata.AAC.5
MQTRTQCHGVREVKGRSGGIAEPAGCETNGGIPYDSHPPRQSPAPLFAQLLHYRQILVRYDGLHWPHARGEERQLQIHECWVIPRCLLPLPAAAAAATLIIATASARNHPLLKLSLHHGKKLRELASKMTIQ